MILAITENAFLSLVGSAIPASTVVVLAATGAMLGERVGVLNLARRDSSVSARCTRSSRCCRWAWRAPGWPCSSA